MAIKKRKPTSPGRRFQTVSDFAEITSGKPEKTLISKKVKTGGRNTQGRVTSRHRGGGHKQRYRVIDFRRDKDGVPARVASIQYDPNRNARIALLNYADGEKRYILAPVGLKVGATILSNDSFQEFHGEHEWLFDEAWGVPVPPKRGWHLSGMFDAMERGEPEVASREFRAVLTDDLIRSIMELVPDEWLAEPDVSATKKRRVYAQFLKNRLLASEIFVEEALRVRKTII